MGYDNQYDFIYNMLTRAFPSQGTVTINLGILKRYIESSQRQFEHLNCLRKKSFLKYLLAQ